MPADAAAISLPGLLRGDPASLAGWTRQRPGLRTLFLLGVILVGAALFGASIGLWRAPRQALYSALKLPGIILLTVGGNALINGMLAPLLGLDLRFRQSFVAVLASFAIAAAILGAFSPLMLFLVWNLPPLAGEMRSSGVAYSALNLTAVTVIALAGTASNLHLLRLLQHWCGAAAAAKRLLVAWLAVNFLLGTQLTWILRPFIGTPLAPVQFLRPDAFRSNFYENVIEHLTRGLFGSG